MTIEIRFFGKPHVKIDGIKQDFTLKKSEAVIYFLALEGAVSRKKLAALFWGDKDEESAGSSLRNALSRLRGQFPDEFITSDRQEAALGEYESDFKSINDITDISRPIDNRFLETFMKDFELTDAAEFSNWLSETRERTRNNVIQLLCDRITQCYDKEDTEELVLSLEALLTADPYDEDSVLELADIYSRSGERSKAIILYKKFRLRLKENLDSVPSQRAEELFHKMLFSSSMESQNDPESCFYGRTAERQKITDKIEQDKPDRHTVFLIEGEPGVGKTSLVNNIIGTLPASDSFVISTLAYETGHDYSYSAWNNMAARLNLLSVSYPSESFAQHMLVLSGIFPGVMNDKGLSYNANFMKMSEMTPNIVAQSINSLLTAVAGDKKIVLTADDLQWFDAMSLRLLEAYLCVNTKPSVIFILTRHEKSAYALRMLHRLENSGVIDLTHIHLAPFSESETLAFCRMFLDNTQLAAHKIDYVFRESEGLPLLVVELIKNLAANSETEHIKGGLGAMILDRFGELSEDHREFMRILSVFTNGAEISSIEGILAQDGIPASQIAEDLLGRQLIKENITFDGKILLDFTHSKVREGIYDTIPAFKKKEYNRKIAETLSRHYLPHTWDPALSSTICYHYTQATMPEKVLSQNLKEMAYHTILNHDLFPLLNDDILLSCKMPFSNSVDTDKKMEKMAALLKMIKGSNQDTDEVAALEASYLELCGGYLIALSHYKEGRIYINRSLDISKNRHFAKTYIYCLQHLGHIYLQTDNVNALLSCAREMLLISRTEGRTIFMGLALRFIGVAFQIKHDFRLSEIALRRSAEILEEYALLNGRYTLSILSARCYIGENYHWQGDFKKARECFEYCIAECENRGLFWGCSYFHAQMANLAFDMGDTELMNSQIYKGADLFEKCQGGISSSILYSLKAIADVKSGKYDDALRSIEMSALISIPMQKTSWRSVHIMALAYLAEMNEEGKLPQNFDRIINKSSREFAREASALCIKQGNIHRSKALAERFAI